MPEKHDDGGKKRRRKRDRPLRILEAVSNTDELIDLLDTLAEHEHSITAGVEALDALEHSGVLDMVKSLDTDERRQAIDTTELLLDRLSAVDPATIEALMDQLPQDYTVSAEELRDAPRVGPLKALMRFRDPKVQKGLGRLLMLLETLGQDRER